MYRMVSVHPEDRGLLDMRWKNEVYIDTALPFGLQSTLKVFNAIADALEWIMWRNGIEHSLHYLDDFLFIGKPQSGGCDAALQLALSVCTEFQLPMTRYSAHAQNWNSWE